MRILLLPNDKIFINGKRNLPPNMARTKCSARKLHSMRETYNEARIKAMKPRRVYRKKKYTVKEKRPVVRKAKTAVVEVRLSTFGRYRGYQLTLSRRRLRSRIWM